MAQLTIVGLGPSDRDTLTRRAEEILLAADEIVVSRMGHPIVRWLIANSRTIVGLESLIDAEGLVATEASLKVLVDRARRQGNLVFAVPGNPIIDDDVAAELIARAAAYDITINVIPSVSYLDAALGIGIASHARRGVQIQVATGFAMDHADPGTASSDPFRGVYRELDPTRPTLIGPMFDDESLGRARRKLVDIYLPEYRVVGVAFARDGGAPSAFKTTLDRLDWSSGNFAICLVVPAIERLKDLGSFDTLRYIVARLRAPDGCPWDHEQNYTSIKKHLVEETYEAVAALDAENLGTFAGELGDVLLQVVMYGQFGREAGDFTIEDVLHAVNEKLLRRHPHVFGDVTVSSSAEVLKNWERIKRGENAGADSTFSGVPEAAPALIRADAIQSRAARYAWTGRAGAMQAMTIDLSAPNQQSRTRYLGERLFEVVAIAREHNLDAEEALRLATNRFRDAFDRVLAACRVEGVAFDSLSFEERRRRLDEALSLAWDA